MALISHLINLVVLYHLGDMLRTIAKVSFKSISSDSCLNVILTLATISTLVLVALVHLGAEHGWTFGYIQTKKISQKIFSDF